MAFLARIAIQLDLAQLYALILVPAAVSFLVWRDGFYTLQGTGILVQACDLPYIWLRFGVYLVVKPFSTYVWRKLLQRRMALALLGLDSEFGKSEFAVDGGGAGNLLQDDDKEARDAKVWKRCVAQSRPSSPVVLGDPFPRPAHPARPSPRSRIHRLPARAGCSAGVTEEQLELVREELTISNLNYSKLYSKLVRNSWLFFTCVVVWQLPAALRVHKTAPQVVTDATLTNPNYTMPVSAAWLYVPATTRLRLDDDLAAAFDERLRLNSSCTTDLRYGGWAGDFGWASGATSAWVSFT